jgi:hypothetical protein
MILNGSVLLRVCFLAFEGVFGLKVNLSKLELVHVGNVVDVEGLVDILGCRVSSLPLKYVGLPLGAGLRPSLFGMGSLRRLIVGWLVGNGCTYLRGVGLPL